MWFNGNAACGDLPPLRCPNHVAEPCTLMRGHPGQLHEHHQSRQMVEQSWPPLRRWWRMRDGSILE